VIDDGRTSDPLTVGPGPAPGPAPGPDAASCPRFDRRAVLAAGLAAAGGLLLAGGCNVVAPVAAVIAGPPQKDAEFILPERRTVVFVDDRAGVIPLRSSQVRRRIGREVTEILNRRDDLLPGLMIDAGDAIALADARDRGGGLLPLGVIGREVGAEVLIAVRIDVFSLVGGQIPQPTAQAAVWVLDITNRERLFPPPDSREPATTVSASLFETDPFGATDESAQVARSFALADALAESVAKVFYRHEIKELGRQLGPR